MPEVGALMRLPFALICSLVFCATGMAARDQANQPTLEDVIARASHYVIAYADKMSLLLAKEDYAQWMDYQGAMHPMRRSLVSEYALVRIGGDWEGFRDVYSVDGQPVGERQDRLQKLLLNTPDGAMRQARQIADESARYNLGQVKRNFNTPTMALVLLQAKNLGRFRFKKAGEDRVSGAAVWKISYEEVKKPTIIRTSAGNDMPIDGTFWIDPNDGRVLKSHMGIKSEARIRKDERHAPGYTYPSEQVTVTTSASITVTYELNEKVGLLVPVEMRELYEAPFRSSLEGAEGTSRIDCRATYSDFRRFETGARLVPK